MQMQLDLEPVRAVLPPQLRTALDSLEWEHLEELRLRAGQAATAVVRGREQALSANGSAIRIQPEQLEGIVSAACRQSIYAVTEAIAQGYLTLPGGHRIGLAGMLVADAAQVTTIRSFSSLNVRIAREVMGCADALVAVEREKPGSLLLIGPPGCGKTTVLRDLIRQLSDKLEFRLGVADVRGELAAVQNGVPQLAIGRHTDVMTGGELPFALIRLLRTMNPQFLAVDEITAEADLAALRQASYCGVSLLATVHADSKEELMAKPLYAELLRQRLFLYLVTIQPNRSLLVERMDAYAQNDWRGADRG
jgi:stage III sporulation protein AA